MREIIIVFCLTVLQNASFTLVSRARNSKSIGFHALAATLSNGIWLMVIQEVVLHVNTWQFKIAYLVGAVFGSVLMHHISMRYFEKGKRKAS